MAHHLSRLYEDITFLLIYCVSAKSKFTWIGLRRYVSIDIDNSNYLLSFCFASDIVLGPREIELKK